MEWSRWLLSKFAGNTSAWMTVNDLFVITGKAVWSNTMVGLPVDIANS